MKVWLLAVLALPSLVYAYSPTSQNDCSPLDLRNSHLAQVRDQKKMAWCYAFTGSDMLADTFDTPERISAADIAISYNQTKLGLLVRWFNLNVTSRSKPNIGVLAHQTGFNKVSLDRAMKEGWCPERIFPSESWTKLSRTQHGWVESQVNLDQAMIDIGALHDARENVSVSNLPYYYKFKNVDAAEFVKILQTKSIASVYASLRETVCKDDRQPFNTHFKTKMVFKNSKIFKRISEQLEVGRLVGLDYDSRLLENSSHRGVKLAELHTSSIVGRRWSEQKNSCEFLIRNSHGDECGDKYDPSYECDAGNVWIPESKIYPGTISIVYMLSN
jgi:hypothetical protein